MKKVHGCIGRSREFLAKSIKLQLPLQEVCVHRRQGPHDDIYRANQRSFIALLNSD